MARAGEGFLRTIDNPLSVITPIPSGILFPESLKIAKEKYGGDIAISGALTRDAVSSAELLEMIRSPKFPGKQRTSLLKIYRRCVALMLDTEMTKKISVIKTADLIRTYGAGFKPISKLKEQFSNPAPEVIATLSALLAENDFRGQQGYLLTGQFFDWFNDTFDDLTIIGPRGAGRDIELSTIFPDFEDSFPSDFVIHAKTKADHIFAVGFARYDSTRGGSQSDDRTGGNAHKVELAKKFCTRTKRTLRIVFLADGPGLAHRDTWEEACALDGAWNDNVRVATLKLSPKRITRKWLLGA